MDRRVLLGGLIRLRRNVKSLIPDSYFSDPTSTALCDS